MTVKLYKTHCRLDSRKHCYAVDMWNELAADTANSDNIAAFKSKQDYQEYMFIVWY